MKNFSFKISVFSGDIIYTLAGIKACCERNNCKAEIYIWLDRPWRDSIDGQTHPYGVNQYALDMMRPLLESQPYVALCKAWEGETVAVDLDRLRTESISTMPRGSIFHWPAQIWPDMHADAGREWITIQTKLYGKDGIKDIYTFGAGVKEVEDFGTKGKIIINRTSRWRNDMIHYWYMREVAKDLVFAGLPQEHEDFCKSWDIDIPLLKVQNFLELAVALKSCKFFIGNQSLCFALAEAMKIPRVLEICPVAPNVIPVGGEAYAFLHQFALEWLVKDLNSRL